MGVRFNRNKKTLTTFYHGKIFNDGLSPQQPSKTGNFFKK